MSGDWAISALLSKTDGKGYVDGTYVDALTYFLSISKEFSENSTFVLTAVGAPQKHGQRDQYLSPAEVDMYGHKYNRDWGMHNGEELNGRNNYYHKPHIVLNHYYNVNDKTTLNTSIYASYGKGGGSGPLGSTSRYYGNTDRTSDGLIDWDKPLKEIHNFMKALTKPYPGAFSFIGKQKIMIWEAQPFDTKITFSDSCYGEVVEKFSSGDLVIRCMDGLLLITNYEGNVESGDTFSNL